MGERITVGLAALAVIIMAPYIMTMVINGRYGETGSKVSSLRTGRDVLIQIDGANVLMDVEQYVAGVLPGLISPDSDASLIEAQAVAVRTKVYYAMGDGTVVNAADLEFHYYTKQDYIDKWGEAKYRHIKTVYENAVLNTVQKIIE